MQGLTISLFGPPQMTLNGTAVAFDTRKAVALLAYLACTKRSHSREALAALLWPEYADARNSLRRTLSTIQRSLGAGWLEMHRDQVSAALRPDLWVDTVQFEAQLADASDQASLEAAAALYHDDFLAGFSLRDCPAFDEWCFFEAERLRRLMAGALESLSALYAEASASESAIAAARRLLALDPLYEPAHRTLMRLYAGAGQRPAALRQYQECARLLERELGAEPLEETVQLYNAIRVAREGPLQSTQQLQTPPPATHPVARSRPVAIKTLAPRSGAIVADERPSVAERAGGAGDQALDDEEFISFGYWVRRRRKALDLTQKALAEQAGCSMAAIRKIEADERRPSWQLAERLAMFLQIHDADREAFLRSARSEQRVARLPSPIAELAPADALAERRPPLPTPLTSLIGRNDEIAALTVRLSDPAVRLLTLTGPPGVGKTRLALAAAHALQSTFAQGAAFVALAPLHDAALVPGAIAQALALPAVAELAPLTQVAAYVRARELLLVLDSADHLLIAPLLGELLAASPRLTVLATSQEALRLSAEHELPVLPLGLPPGDRASPEALSASAAVALFVARAQAISPSFALTADNARAVAALCAQLDGLPLAIELAAARSRLFTPQSLLARLDQRLALLRDGPRDHPERHQSLHAAIEWSVRLLREEERRLFARLSVFEGGWTLEATVAVCSDELSAGEPGYLESAAIIDRLDLLCRKSLVGQSAGRDGERRLTLLESLRIFARAQLRTMGQVTVIERRHAEYYLRLIISAAAEAPPAPEWLRLVDEEYANLRAALRWAAASDRVLAARLCIALEPFWRSSSLIHEGRRWVADLLSAEPDAPTSERAQLLGVAGELAYQQSEYAEAAAHYAASLALADDLAEEQVGLRALGRLGWVAMRRGSYEQAARAFEALRQRSRLADNAQGEASALSSLGWMAREQGDYTRAQAYHEESLTLYRAMGDVRSVAYTLNNLGWAVREQGDYARAQAYHEESLTYYRGLDDQGGSAHALNNLGWVAAMRGDNARALALHEQSLAVRRSLGDLRALAWSLADLAWALYRQGDYAQARARYAQSLDCYQELGDRRGIAVMRCNLGITALAEGQLDAARAHLHASLVGHRDLGDQRGAARCLAAHAALYAAIGEAERAARLLAAGATLRAKVGVAVPTPDLGWYREALAATQAGLGGSAFALAWEAGQRLAAEEAIRQAFGA